MFNTMKNMIISIFIISNVATTSMYANNVSDTQLHAVLSVITNMITSKSAKVTAIEKVSEYADSDGSIDVPTVEDYEDIGITNVDSRVIVAVNEAVLASESSQVDSDTEIQALVNQVLAIAPVLTLVGSENVSLALNSTYTEDGAIAIDNIDGDISGNVDKNGTLDVNTSIAGGSFTIRYNIDDSDGNSADEITREVNISNTVDSVPPTFNPSTDENNVSIDDTNVSVYENQLYVMTLNGSDLYTIRFSIKDGNSSLLSVNVETGVVTFNEAPDYESGFIIYVFTAVISDGAFESEKNITINILDVDELPPIFNSDANITVNENHTGTVIELNASDTIIYGKEGTDADKFNLDTSTGIITFVDLPDYEEQRSYTFTATASDAIPNTAYQTVIITISDEDDEAPEFTMTMSEDRVEEQVSAITLTATDIDSDDSSIVYSIKDGNSSYFNINSASGEVVFKVAPDYEDLASSYDADGFIIFTFTATATDGVGNANDADITINVYNITETELKKTKQSISYDENGTVINNDILDEDDKLKDDGFYQEGQLHIYTRDSDGIVSDNITNLEWQDNVTSVQRTWNAGITYCTTLTLGNYDDWRLPSPSELESLVLYNTSTVSLSIDTVFEHIQGASYWTSLPYLGPTDDGESHAWIIEFINGKNGDLNIDLNSYVRCVRD